METASAKVRAVVFSLAIHLLLALVLYRGLMMQPEIRDAGDSGPAIEATLVTAPRQGVLSQARHVETERQPSPPTPQPPVPQPPAPQPQAQPQEQPLPRQLKSQTQLPKPDTVDQDEVRRLAQQAADRQQKEQEERRRQAQIDLDRKQEQRDAENRQRQADALEKQLADLRAKRAEAERQVKLAQEKLKQDEDMRKSMTQNTAPTQAARQAPPASHGGNNGLYGQYISAIKATVKQNWHTANVPENISCTVHFKQLPGGEVFDVNFLNCPYDAAARATVVDALKRTPLPYAGFESVFVREGTIDLCYPEETCGP